jgi:hypothetical protein
VESARVSSAAGGVTEDPPSSQCFTGDIPLLTESTRISSATGGVTEDPPSSHCFTGDIHDILGYSTSRGISPVKH